ncbi:MAG: DUF420 domain-containing protein [Janthinobacterium lividum]
MSARLVPLPLTASHRRYQLLLGAVGLLVPLLVAGLYAFPTAFRLPGTQVRLLPAINAGLNSLTASSLLAGYYFIRRGQVKRHRTMMGLAFGLGGLFLLSYVAYHSQAASTPYGGSGGLRYLYFFLLLTHISLAAVTVGLVLFTHYFALTGQYARHRRLARWTFPVWLYVSVTGVVVYFLIAPYYPPA